MWFKRISSLPASVLRESSFTCDLTKVIRSPWMRRSGAALEEFEGDIALSVRDKRDV